MSDWRLIALDLDGTLLGADGTISAENEKWIRLAREAGIEVTIATGRPTRLMRSFFEQLQLTMPFVVVNGSEVWTAGGQLLERHTLHPKDVRFLYELAVRYGTRYWSSVVDHVFPPETFPDRVENYKWLKFGMQCNDPSKMKEIWNRLQQYGKLEISSSGEDNVEINPLGVSKATGLQTVCRYLGIDRKQVIAIGDGLNDVSMLRWAGLGIAMGNAHEKVKEVAGKTTAPHSEDGVARAIERLLHG